MTSDHNGNGEGSSRRKVLECMTWAGTDVHDNGMRRITGQPMSDISDAKRDAAECRRLAAAETNPNIAEQLHLIADAWDKVIRAHDENVQRLTRPDPC